MPAHYDFALAEANVSNSHVSGSSFAYSSLLVFRCNVDLLYERTTSPFHQSRDS